MPKSTFQIDGLDKLLKNLDKMPKELVEEIDMELEAGAQNMVAGAKRMAPVDHGVLQNGISYAKHGVMDYEYFSQARYSAYVEFGTGTLKQIPAGLEEIAEQFWTKRKDWIGMQAQPFFFPPYYAEKPKIIEWVKKVIENL